MRILFIILVFLFCYSAKAQVLDSVFTIEMEIKQTGEDLYADAMGNIFLVNDKQQIKKLNNKGDSIAVYNLSKRLGKPTFIDATYPLKVMFFFQDFSTAVTVDRLLNVTNNIDLRRTDIFQVHAIASSYDNQFWIYDEQIAKLKKINNQGIVTQETIDMRQILNDAPSPHQIIDNDNLVYVYDSTKGVYTFDYYGGFKRFTPFVGFEKIYVFNKIFYGIKNNIVYNVKEGGNKMITSKFALPIIPGTKKIFVEKNKFYYLHQAGITVYSTQL